MTWIKTCLKRVADDRDEEEGAFIKYNNKNDAQINKIICVACQTRLFSTFDILHKSTFKSFHSKIILLRICCYYYPQ